MKQSSEIIDVMKLFSQKVTIPPGLEDLVGDYARNIMIDLIILEKSIKNQEIENPKKIIHKLKGTAKSYGFNTVDSILVIMQRLMQEGKSKEMLLLSNKLVKYVEDFLRDQKI